VREEGEGATNGIIGYTWKLVGAYEVPDCLNKGFDDRCLRELFGI
jgi:hypothetical protein